MNNSTNNTAINTCEWFPAAGKTAQMFTYIGVTPFYFVFGLFGHALCLIAFYQQAKKEKEYAYQIYVTFSETFEVLAYAFFTLTMYWLSDGRGRTGVDWFRSSYGCMWITAHMSTPLVNVFVTSCLLFAVAMSADRIFALKKPILYKKINHKRHQRVALCICAFIGVSTSVFDCFRYYPLLDTGTGLYSIKPDSAFTGSLTGGSLAHLRNAVRAVGLVALIACNIAMIISYRNYTRQADSMQSTNSTNAKKRADQQRTLVVLAACDSLFNTLAMTYFICFYGALYIYPPFATCQQYFFGPTGDGWIQLCDTMNFYVIFAFNKSFRQMIFRSVPGLKRFAVAAPSATGKTAQPTSAFSTS
jgi:hypothetical protein